jgi:MSHA biogenesis protein MshG
MVDRLRQGESLSDVLRVTAYLPSFARRMMGAGKDASELARSCDIVARHYDREAAHLTKNVNTIIEPIMTVAMAGIVLLVALSVFLPMWGMVRLHH